MKAVKQQIGKEGLSSVLGLAVIVVSLIILLAASFFFRYLSSLGVAPLITSTGFWLVGGIVAAYVFHRYVISYVYTLDGVKLIVERVFSRKPRFMQQILLREIVFIGPLETAKEKYRIEAKQKAVRKQEKIEENAIVYKRDGEMRALIIQPNAELLEALKELTKK